MNKAKRIVNALFGILFCLFFVFSVVDTNEFRQKTNFDQTRITAHVEKLSENGPRSIMDKESNAKAVEYIVSQLESLGLKEEDTTSAPAYVVQDFVAKDTDRQNWYLENVIVHIPANGAKKTNEAVMFMGHLDSVPMGQGSSDDGVACAVMLEAIRYYLDKISDGYTLSNDLVFCFVNGEEFGMYGSEAFMAEFDGFNGVVERIGFAANLESRGTSGTLIMFETSANNYRTVKLFSEVNRSLFTCSIATMVYDMMPNNTDFTSFKEAYQGINMANIGGGEDYHTQNDDPASVGASYLSQQAQIVDGLIARLADYDLSQLYDADESAIFFSYLNVTTVVYNHATAIVLAVLVLALVVANVLLSVFLRKERNVKNTAKAFVAVAAGLLLAAVAAYACYYLFQLIAAVFGVIDIHAIGTISYSNTAIVVGLGILVLGITVLTTHFACKWWKIGRRDMTRACAYLHATLGVVLSFLLPDASYLFIFSGLLFSLNEVLVTAIKRTDFARYHGEVLATALYLPIVLPVIVLATSALGMTMAYVYGLVFALTLFPVGIWATPAAEYASVRTVVGLCRNASAKKKGSAERKRLSFPAWEGATHILAVALSVFLVVSLIAPNASVNLQGKQSNSKLPYDDALVYVVEESGATEYRVYDLNAVRALKKYAPALSWKGEYYAGEGKTEIGLSVLSTASGNALTVVKSAERAIVYLEFTNIDAQSFTIDDGKTTNTYPLGDSVYGITVHTDCTITVNGGEATVSYREVVRDYAPLVPASYAADEERLHFNLWFLRTYSLS